MISTIKGRLWLVTLFAFGVLFIGSGLRAGDAVSVNEPERTEANEVEKIDNQVHAVEAFKPGEEVTLSVRYMGFSGGEITVEVGEANWEGKDVYTLEMTGRSGGIARWFYPLDDRWISYMDREELFSWGYDYHKDHGDDSETQKVRYDQEGGVVIEEGEEDIKIPPRTQDVLTAVYYLRTQPFEVGDVYQFPVHVGGETYVMKVTVAEISRVATYAGWKDGYRLVPEVVDEEQMEDVEDRLEGDASGVEVWVSDDEYRVPILISIPARFGTLYGYLENHVPGE